MAVYICTREEIEFKAFFPACRPPLKKEPLHACLWGMMKLTLFLFVNVSQVPISDNYPSSWSMYSLFPFFPTSRITHLHHNHIKTHIFIQTPKKRTSITLVPYLALTDKTWLIKPAWRIACPHCWVGMWWIAHISKKMNRGKLPNGIAKNLKSMWSQSWRLLRRRKHYFGIIEYHPWNTISSNWWDNIASDIGGWEDIHVWPGAF